MKATIFIVPPHQIPGKGQSARHAVDDRLPTWRENGLKNRAIATDMTVPPGKNGKNAGLES